MGCCFSSSSSSPQADAAGAAGTYTGGTPGQQPAHASPAQQQQQQLQLQLQQRQARPSKREAPTKNYAKPKWKAPQPLPENRLRQMCEAYWDTEPHYGGDRVIWDAIKAAVEAPDLATTRLILEAAGVVVARPDMTVMYDERGARYVLPEFVLAPPSNLVAGGGAAGAQQQPQQQPPQQQHGGEVQLQPMVVGQPG